MFTTARTYFKFPKCRKVVIAVLLFGGNQLALVNSDKVHRAWRLTARSIEAGRVVQWTRHSKRWWLKFGFVVFPDKPDYSETSRRVRQG